MTPDELVGAALEAAEEGLAAGEQPIGAVVLLGDEIIGRAYTQERTSGRRLVHADLLAMVQADEALGWRRRPHPVRLAVSLEPCVMCLGAAMAMRVDECYFALESPGDGGAALAAAWRPSPDLPWFAPPKLFGGIRREESRSLFRRYCETAPESGARRWAQSLLTVSSPATGP
ncbi:nucleoside deaminase [Micromonospora carbonacea]|uniref:Nucleoside deaminase n=1 Tax=Micromonospora carbonacea TaxID=47853 RepID=A0A7H8XTP0_9ACTN|nr:nucleoside deaminase [Micromonospora carbonacea]MBB5829870.1 tRNA(adenine34) deaminase [Micromonospora carbonacea]QLD28165.1 nucleoside deaminase [Micromonospora carbonacea]